MGGAIPTLICKELENIHKKQHKGRIWFYSYSWDRDHSFEGPEYEWGMSVMSVSDFMRFSFVTAKDQLIHLSGSLIVMARMIKAAESIIEPS
jgi:hypothetical protein